MTDLVKITRALISVSDKTGLAEFGQFLASQGVEVLSTGGTARTLREAGVDVKVVSEAKYDEVLGVHMVGPHATDLISEACVALRLEATIEEIFRTIHPHPTLPEAVMEAAEAVHGMVMHIYQRPKK